MTILLVVTLFVLTGINTAGRESQVVGVWVATDPSTQGLTRLRIQRTAAGFTAEARARCDPSDCDWGTATLDSVPVPSIAGSSAAAYYLTGEFRTGAMEEKMIVEAEMPRGLLRVHLRVRPVKQPKRAWNGIAVLRRGDDSLMPGGRHGTHP